MNWHQTAKARRILATLTADDITIEPFTPVIGPRCYVWHIRQSEELNAIRKAVFEARHGTYAEAWNAGRASEYLAAHEAVPSLHDVLVEMFGEPPCLGSFIPALSAQVAKEQVEATLAAAVRSIAA